MRLNVSHKFLPKTPTVRTSRVLDDFGIDFEQGRHVIADDFDFDLQPGNVVAFTGASGSGKSSLLRAVVNELREAAMVIDLDDVVLGDRPLVDALPGSVEDAMQLLSQCGLGEAHLMLRTPAELSEGQRYRFRLALAISEQPDWIVADEFTATLDRTLAKVVSFGIRRHASKKSSPLSSTPSSTPSVSNLTGFLIATTHEDVLDDLVPDVHVRCELDGEIEVTRHERKKKDAARSTTTSGSARRPVAIGRISLGGITGRTTSG